MATLFLNLDNGEALEYDTQGNYRYVESGHTNIDTKPYKKDDVVYHVRVETNNTITTREGKNLKTMLKRALSTAIRDKLYYIDIYTRKRRNTLIKFRGKSDFITIYNEQDDTIFKMSNTTLEILNCGGDNSHFFSTLLHEIADTKKKAHKGDTRPKRELLVEKYGQDFVNKENYLKNYYSTIQYKNLSIDDLYKLLTYVAEAHRYMTKVMNIDVYPKLKFLDLEKPVERNWGHYNPDGGISLRLLNEHPIHILATYAHEYGHYIHEYLTKGTHRDFTHNKQIFKEMVADLRRGETVAKIRQQNWRESTKKYMLSGDELIARAFEFYCLRQYKEKGMIPTLEPLNSYSKEVLFYTDSELKIFVKHMSRIHV